MKIEPTAEATAAGMLLLGALDGLLQRDLGLFHRADVRIVIGECRAGGRSQAQGSDDGEQRFAVHGVSPVRKVGDKGHGSEGGVPYRRMASCFMRPVWRPEGLDPPTRHHPSSGDGSDDPLANLGQH